MRFFVVFLVWIASCNIVVGAQDEVQADSSATITNSIWDNWYGQLDIDMTLMNPYGTNFMEALPKGKAFGIDIGVGKWFRPEFGIRAKVNWENGIFKNEHAVWLGKEVM